MAADVPHDESEADWFRHLDIYHKSVEVVRRTVVGVYSEGFVQSGNFAYLSLVALFAFCIVAAAIAGGLGQTQSGLDLIEGFFRTVNGEGNGDIAAYDEKSGEKLWRFNCGAGVNAPPISYAIDGKQYVAVAAGGSQIWGFRQGGAVIVFGLAD